MQLLVITRDQWPTDVQRIYYINMFSIFNIHMTSNTRSYMYLVRITSTTGPLQSHGKLKNGQATRNYS